MSARRRRWPWIAFAACTALITAVLAGMTALTLSMAAEDAELRTFADQQEPVRLALWRMDSWAAPVIARENARGADEYESYFTQEIAYNREFAPIMPGEVLTPSPLLTFESPYIELHFQIRADGRVTSPQAPVGNTRDVAEFTCSTVPFDEHDETLASVTSLLQFNAIDDRLAAARKGQRLLEYADAAPQQSDLGWVQQQQIEWSSNEFQQRQRAADALNMPRKQNRAAPQKLEMLPSQVESALVSEGPGTLVEEVGALAPVWCDPVSGEEPVLVFVRTVEIGGMQSLQGFVVDWSAMAGRLMSEIDDLLPEARLEPVRIEAPASIGAIDATRVMATMPVMLVPGQPAAIATTPSSWSSVFTPLAAMWAAVLIAMIVSGLTLRAVMALGRRRAQFASAVTHELRTPLTSFQLYTEMLADGMVSDPEQRQSYLEALRRQAGRLSAIVENILAFARVEDGRARMQRARVTAAELLDRSRSALEERVDQNDGALRITIDDDVRTARLDVDADAVSRILFNLIDNACKYGGDGQVTLAVTTTTGEVRFEVCDEGPGVPSHARQEIFTPFQRGPAAADGAIPGAGVGLALSRALARDMGGDLECRDGDGGGCFVLRLPTCAREG